MAAKSGNLGIWGLNEVMKRLLWHLHAMIGRDYYSWGSKRHISFRSGDNRGNPYLGPIAFSFFEPHSKLVLWNRLGTIFIQSLLGNVETYIHPQSSKPQVESKLQSEDDFFDDDDWQLRYLAADTASSQAVAKAQRYYLDLCPLAVCILPTASMLAVADVKYKIKLVDLDSMTIRSSFGGAGLEPGTFSAPSAIEAVQVGKEFIILVGDSGAGQRVQAFSSAGRLLAHIGEKGPMPGQFRDIASLSAYVDHPMGYSIAPGTDLFVHQYTPRWYRGKKSTLEELEEDLMHMTNQDPALSANFVVAQREKDPSTYDLLHVTESKRIVRLTIKQELPSEERGEVSGEGFYIANRVGDKVSHPSIFALIRNERDLHYREECRDSLVIAAVDRKNFRVQVLRMFWTTSQLFSPSMDVIQVLGGSKNLRCTLLDPVCARFSAGQELAICDNGAGSVLILSANMEIIKVLQIAYLSPRDALQIGRKRDKNAMTNLELENSKKACWVDFSTTGQLAIGYKSGGVYIFESCRAGAVGSLIRVEVSQVLRLAHPC